MSLKGKVISLCMVAFLFGLTVWMMASAQERTRSPHGTLNIPCEKCHDSASWKPLRSKLEFDHGHDAKYPLSGMHKAVGCTQCHVSPVFKQASADCATCHADLHRRQLGAACENCHSTNSWRVGMSAVQHHTDRFPLLSAHAAANCESCHTGAATATFTGLNTACASCHINDYNNARILDHRAANLPLTCENCHTETRWLGASSFHTANSIFPLLGAHATLTCAQCHLNGVFTALSTACASCHIADYNSTTNPNHIAAGFPVDCQVCHNTIQWAGATFNHSLTPFPLTGAHTTVACASCHVGGRYAGTPTDCYSCHTTEYTTVTNPNHVAAGLATTCQSCHTTTSWSGAQIPTHTFPIYTGTHAGQWTTCNDCHTNPANYALFSCVDCHAHPQAQTNQIHANVRNYVYNSANCYSCHPQGRAN